MSLNHYFHEASQTCMMSNEQRKIPRLQFGQLLSKAWGRSATTSNGVSGFRTTGIHPFDPSVIPIHALSMSQVHAEEEARQLQPETHSSQSIRVKSAPSASNEHAGLESHESSAYEVNTNVNTPRKVLQTFLQYLKFLGGKIRSGSSQLLS
jgi:hypothetical protein